MKNIQPPMKDMKKNTNAIEEAIWLYDRVLQGRYGTKERSSLLLVLEHIIKSIEEMAKINEEELRKSNKITRVEVIDHSKHGKGREYVKWDEKVTVDMDLQDGGRTLKVFISDRK